MTNRYYPYIHIKYPQYRPHNFSQKFVSTDNCAQTDLPPKIQEKKEKPVFEFHGIKLYIDDLLILILIYFLYKENMDDLILYILLFSLLLEQS